MDRVGAHTAIAPEMLKAIDEVCLDPECDPDFYNAAFYVRPIPPLTLRPLFALATNALDLFDSGELARRVANHG